MEFIFLLWSESGTPWEQAANKNYSFKLDTNQSCEMLLNRPGVAGAVLQSPPSLIN